MKSPNKESNARDIGFWKMAVWAFRTTTGIKPKSTILYTLVSCLDSLGGIGKTYFIAKVLDSAISIATNSNGSIHQAVPLLVAVTLFKIATAGLTTLKGYLYNSIVPEIRTQLERKLYYKLKEIGTEGLENPDVNNNLNRALANLQKLTNFYFEAIRLNALVIKFITIGVIVLKFNPLITVSMILAAVPQFFADRKFRAESYKYKMDSTEDRRKVLQAVSAITTAGEVPEIYINNALVFFDKIYTSFMSKDIRIKLAQITKWTCYELAGDTLTTIASTLALIVLISKVMHQEISIGTLYFQYNMITNLSDLVGSIFSYINDMNENSIHSADVYRIFHATKPHANGTRMCPIYTKGPQIDIEQVCFKYPSATTYAIQDLNIKIRSGEKIAIVGANGAGKTTLLKLITKQYRVSEGNIKFNGININDYDDDSLFKNMGVLWQEYNRYPFLDVAQNIYVGKSDAPIDMQKVKEAAEAADAMKFIESYPNKFAQILSEQFTGGLRPSTGQWQKIAIARFFYRNSPLVVFDEPTASIDAISEYNIFNKIYEFFTNKTVILVSHRFSTVRNADRIIVLEKGQVHEEGTHEQLMELGGEYAKAFNIQAEGYKTA